MHQQDIPAGLCQCGCGGTTRIAPYNRPDRGWTKGVPLRYLPHHGSRFDWNRLHYREEDRGHTTPCWIWTGTTNTFGYGLVKSAGVTRMAHRAKYEMTHGPVDPELHMDHLCRVHPCINPDHLEPVTPAVNTRRGTRTKLTREQVAQIKDALDAGTTGLALARQYGVSPQLVSCIRNGQLWR
jgi:hypothetical protein